MFNNNSKPTETEIAKALKMTLRCPYPEEQETSISIEALSDRAVISTTQPEMWTKLKKLIKAEPDLWQVRRLSSLVDRPNQLVYVEVTAPVECVILSTFKKATSSYVLSEEERARRSKNFS